MLSVKYGGLILYCFLCVCFHRILLKIIQFETKLWKIQENIVFLFETCTLHNVHCYLMYALLLHQVKVDPSLQVETKLNPYNRRMQMDKLRSRIVGGSMWQKRRLEDIYR